MVVGASGFVGSRFLAEALDQGLRAEGTGCTQLAGGRLLSLDLSRTLQSKSLLTVCHHWSAPVAVIFAGLSAIDYCGQHRQQSWLVNVDNTIALIRFLQQQGFKVVFISTDNVFAGGQPGYKETDEVGPLNEYGRQKVEVERFLLAEVPDSLIVRLAKVCAGFCHPKNLFDDWLACLQRQATIYCIRGQHFSPTSVEDVAQVLVQLIRQQVRGLFHVAGATWQRAKLAELFIAKCPDLDGQVIEKGLEEFHFREPRTLHASLDNAKVVAATGFGFTPMEGLIDQFMENREDAR